ncbi:MAG: HypC/HybG/HupF family hydrogenase formation chaperone [Chloroflexi bacterium]|nr:HypC/HybG/HupF family hydrogenase formation chaperone [Ktedonobacteraceae bacterium]MBV8821541.1 HypC/HybG/HupF family hydrogenase formation chaperone [Ktedonobacteraceae bacterium]MBV9020892.1 HypC/HybG/HupF family hydrogenase formation chaperone [Ktedonobacteraceae bacterium]MBV9708622.1 HypC/HybG/HupF family hydrogenase formation chaperone [Chloroflexota bacterium]
MSNKEPESVARVHESIVVDNAYCQPDAQGHCVTCSDEALPARVLQVNQETGLALVALNDTTEEVDVTLVEAVAPGDQVLVHGGVALALL